ncbi:MAG: HNH endonuclease [Gammaproteobacteria bacterium]|nr:HNH endonuclease [Gammaproteobacteria bacterium]
MSHPAQETVQYAEFIPEDDYSVLEESPELDFIPDDPAELRCAVTDMAAHINLADWRFIKLVAAMDRRRGWDERGYCSLGNWLDHRCGLGPCAARERIRIGRALARLPDIDAAFRDGILSYSKVRAITRVATRDTEAMLLDIAGRSSAAQLESLVRTCERVDRSNVERIPSEQRRSLSWHYEDGMLVVTAAVPAERGALVIKALQKVVDARKDEREAYFESVLAEDCRAVAPTGDAEPAAADGETADAEHVAELPETEQAGRQETNGSANVQVAANGQHPDGVAQPARVAGGLRDVSAEAERPDVDVADDVAESDDLPASLVFDLSNTGQRYADALVDVAEHYLANGPGNRERRTGQRYEVVLTIDRNELAERAAEGGARYHVEPDWGVDEEDARRIACDVDVTEFIEDARGNLLNYERRRRVVPARLLRALKLRDHNRCRFPGCPHQRYVEAHHVEHWIDGGETRLSNLVLLCSAHHRLLHHGAFHIAAEDDGFVFVSRDGEVIEPALLPQFPRIRADVSEGVSEGTQLLGPATLTARSSDWMAATRNAQKSSADHMAVFA